MEESGRYFEDLAVGDHFSRMVDITADTIDESARILGDFNPLHVDEAFAKASRFGSRILHGMMTSALMGGPVGMYFHGTAIAYLEHNARFTAPVRAGDVLKLAWTISALEPKPRHGGGIVEMVGRATNQDDVVVAEATGKILVRSQP